ncbi:hypothetical protein GA0115240_159031 [Streptomyces sp. DvalAA-14]|nr:hypothetical protein GA0115240_159031 [Streptomyces sp. DvalAA-14]
MEDARLRYLAAPPPPDLEAEPQGLQRVPAAGDPPVGEPEAGGLQDLLGQLEHLALPSGRGRTGGPGRAPGPAGPLKERCLVDLAVSGERQFPDQMDVVRAHVRGQAVRQVAGELLVGQVLAEDDERQQLVRPLLAEAACTDVRLQDRRVREDVPLHLAGLDPEAADLDLAVGPPDVLQPALAVAPDQVAGAVVRLPAAVEPGHAHEAPPCLLGKVAVSGRQPVPAQEQFGDLSGRGDALAARHDQDRGRARQGPADRHHLAVEVPRNRVAEREGGGLRRAVDVEQLGAAAGVVPVPAPDHRGVELLSARQDLADRGEAVRHGGGHRVEQRGRDEEGVYPLPSQRRVEQLGCLHVHIAQDHAAAAGQQRYPDLETQRVEGRVGQAGKAHAGLDADVAGLRQPQHSGLAHLNALGTSARSGSVEHEGHLARGGRRLRGRALFRDPREHTVHDQRPNIPREFRGRRVGAVHQRHRRGVLQDVAAALRGALDVQGYYQGAQPEDAEHDADQPPRTRQRHRHRLPRGDAAAAQRLRHGGGRGVERCVVQPHVAVGEGGGPRSAQGLVVYPHRQAVRGARVPGAGSFGGLVGVRHQSSRVTARDEGGASAGPVELSAPTPSRTSSAVRTEATRGSSSLSSMSQ